MFFFILLVSGQLMERLDREVSFRELLFAGHKSFGVLVLLLLTWRIYLLLRVWGRKYSKHLPKLTGNWYFTTALHAVLYLMMLVVPLSGYWLSNAYKEHNVSLFFIPMPDLFPVDGEVAPQMSGVHGRTSKAFAILIFIHIICQYKVVKANWRRFSNWLQQLTGRSSLPKN